MENIVSFLSLLSINNNRDWFNENKELYTQTKEQFDAMIQQLIYEIGQFDARILNATPQECVFRIYRDLRFTQDKRPYKEQFSGFIAYPMGWKSDYAGYYIHIDPTKAYFSAGIWRPAPAMLKKLRYNAIDFHSQLQEIQTDTDFVNAFGDSLYDNERLKRIPTGFPKDFVDPELIKLKHYIVNHDLGDAMDMSQQELIQQFTTLAKTAYPFIQFLNEAVDR